MADMRATPRNKLLGWISDRLESGKQFANRAQVPVLGGVGDLLMGNTPEEISNWSYGDLPFEVPEESSLPQPKTGERAMNLVDVLGAAPLIGAPIGLARMAARPLNSPQAMGALRRATEALGVPPNPYGGANVIKQRGGQWLSGSVEDSLRGLKHGATGRSGVVPLLDWNAEAVSGLPENVRKHLDENFGAYNIEQDGPDIFNAARAADPNAYMQDWIDKQLTRYVKTDMATPEDPIRALAERGVLHFDPQVDRDQFAIASRKRAGVDPSTTGTSDLARRWDETADSSIFPSKAKEWTNELNSSPEKYLQENPWLLKVPPETNVYSPEFSGETLGFSHLIDELRNATNPESGLPPELLLKYSSLPKVSVSQAVQRVHDINQWRAAQMAEANKALAMNPATQMLKEYPDSGMRWVELKEPQVNETLPDAERTYEALEQALKHEGDTMGHCVGGYCDDVATGRSRIFSLRDAKGQPHVTIETKPEPGLFDSTIPLRRDAANAFRELYGPEIDVLADYGKDFARSGKHFSQYGKEFANWLRHANPDVYAETYGAPKKHKISQIKGKQNRAPNPEYLAAVQDFIRTQGPWSEVGDLQNTGMRRLNDGSYMTEAEYDDMIKRSVAQDTFEGPVKPGQYAAGGAVVANDTFVPDFMEDPQAREDFQQNAQDIGGALTDPQFYRDVAGNAARAAFNPGYIQERAQQLMQELGL